MDVCNNYQLSTTLTFIFQVCFAGKISLTLSNIFLPRVEDGVKWPRACEKNQSPSTIL